MLRKIMLLLAAAMLLSCACAEEAAGNPFIGTWNVLYGISDEGMDDYSDYGKTAAVTFADDTVQIIDGEDSFSVACTYAGSKCYAEIIGELFLFSIDEYGRMQMGIKETFSEEYVILARDGEEAQDYDAPFLGYWVRVNPDTEDGNVVLFTPYYVFNIDYNGYMECTYTAAGCIVYQNGAAAAVCTIDENDVMTFSISNGSGTYQLVRTEYEQ